MTPDQLIAFLDELDAKDAGDGVVKEMYDATFPRVDVVSGPAHRMKFIVLKAQGLERADPDAIAQVRRP